MKIMLRFVISGLVVALIVVLCVFVFFRPNNAVDAYNTLSKAFSESGEITTMQKTIQDTVIEKGQKSEQIVEIFPNYQIIENELNSLKQNYSKMLLYENEKDASETLKNKAKDYISLVEKFNVDLGNYKKAVESDASSSAINEIEAKLNTQMQDQISQISELNLLVFDCLEVGFYGSHYTYDVAFRAIASIYSTKVADETSLKYYLALLDESKNHINSVEFEGGNKFLYYLWELDLKSLFKNSDVYLGLFNKDADLTNKAQYVLNYVETATGSVKGGN